MSLATPEPIVEDKDAWATLEYPLSLGEIQRLGWMRDRIDATVFLYDRGLFQRPQDAKRLVYARHLIVSRRLSEHFK